MAQFNKNQMHRKLQRDLKVAYRVFKNYRMITDNREDNENLPAGLRFNWSQLDNALQIVLQNFEQFWAELQEIRTTYGRGLLNPEDISELDRARLKKVKATSNVLTNAQLDFGFNNETDFPSDAANRWEKFYEVASAAHDLCIKLRSRARYWRSEWRTLQPDDEAGEMQAFLRRINIASNLLKAFIEDIATNDNSARSLGRTKGEIRKIVSRPSIDEVTGNLALLNEAEEEAGDVTNPLAEVDPDIHYTRDITELGTDTA